MNAKRLSGRAFLLCRSVLDRVVCTLELDWSVRDRASASHCRTCSCCSRREPKTTCPAGLASRSSTMTWRIACSARGHQRRRRTCYIALARRRDPVSQNFLGGELRADAWSCAGFCTDGEPLSEAVLQALVDTLVSVPCAPRWHTRSLSVLRCWDWTTMSPSSRAMPSALSSATVRFDRFHIPSVSWITIFVGLVVRFVHVGPGTQKIPGARGAISDLVVPFREFVVPFVTFWNPSCQNVTWHHE